MISIPGKELIPYARGFVYLWVNTTNGKMYLGAHVGTHDDGYIGSGVGFRAAWKKYPRAVWRRIILCDTAYPREVEGVLLTVVDAVHNPRYYNLTNRAQNERATSGWEKLTPEQYKSWCASIRAVWDEDARARASRKSKETRAYPGVKEAISSSLSAYLEDPAARAARSEKMLAHLVENPEAIEARKISLDRGRHTRWHVNRGVKSTTCSLCTENNGGKWA